MTEGATRPGVEQPKPAAKLPPRWFVRSAWALHRGLYAATGGRVGSKPATETRAGTLRLRTIGRRTGEERHVMLAYILDGEDFVTMAMNGWADPEPAWWLNLQVNPEAWVDLREATIPVTGRTATPEERAELWPRLQQVARRLDDYAALRSHQTALVILEPRVES
jgi:deazaflavin-dependent oxidoreductase (nitroreductase family)